MRRALLLVLTSLSVAAQTDEPARPPAPEIEWVKGEPAVVELTPAEAARLVPALAVPAPGDGRFLFGPTTGYDAKAGGGGLVLQPRTEDGSRADPLIVKQGRRGFGFVYGAGDAVDVPVEFIGGRWKYRVAAVLEVKAGDVTLCFLDANGNGWFDDLDVDEVAVGAAKDAARLKFDAFTGEIAAGGKRWLVSANPRAAGLWPLSNTVSKDYVRHVSEVNAVRRFGGIPPVGLAEELIPLCEAHSRYCAKNGLTHYEEKSRPLFTPEGEYAGRHSNVGAAVDGKAFIRQLLRTLWHRNFYYDGNLKRVSVGVADGYASSDVRSYGAYDRTPAFAPFPRSLDAPIDGTTESPNPYPAQPRPGPFVTVLFPLETKAVYREGSIRARGGEPLKFDWTDTTCPPAAAKSHFPTNDSCLVLIPHLALKPDTMYDVRIVAEVNGKEETFQWSFRTRK